MSWTSILPALKKKGKRLSQSLAIVKARLDNEKKESSSLYPENHLALKI
jgi:hypothetical protein